jgi:hypothetical protein
MVDRPLRYDEIYSEPAPPPPPGPSASNQTGDGFDQVVVTRVADVEVEHVRWLWGARIPRRKLTVLDGDPGVGKSTVTLDIAARVSTGSPMPDGQRLDGSESVIVLSAEDGIADTIRPRLEAAQGDVGRVYVLEAVSEDEYVGGPGSSRLFDVAPLLRPVSLAADVKRLDAVVRRLHIALVIVDPLMAFMGTKVDSHRDQDVRSLLLPLAKMADDTGAAVLVVRHMNKGGGQNALYRGSGSIGIIGAARAGMLAAPDPQDESRRVLAVTKSNLAEMPPALTYRVVGDQEHECARITWEGQSGLTASDLLRFEPPDERDEHDAAAEFLQSMLEGGGRAPKEIEKEGKVAGFSLDQLKRAKRRADVHSVKEGFGDSGRWVWALREHPETPERPKGAKGVGTRDPAPFAPLGGSAAPLDKPDMPLEAWERERIAAIRDDDPDHGTRVAQARAEAARRRRDVR